MEGNILRKKGLHLAVFGFILLALLTRWGEPDSAVAQPGAESTIYLPWISKPPVGVVISQVKVIQGTSASPNYAVYIAGRETMLRAFVGKSSGESVSGVTARLCGYAAGGQSLGCMYADNGPINTLSQEGSLDSTLNFKLPLAWVKPGFAFHIDLNPANLDPNNVSGSGRFPLSGKQAVNFVTVPDLDVVVVPINYRPYQSAQTFVPETDDLSYLTGLPIKVFPVSTIRYHEHAFYAYAPSSAEENLDRIKGWITLLANVRKLRDMEDPFGSKHFYGLVNSYDAHACSGGCIAGIGSISENGVEKTAVGWSGFGAKSNAASETITHELGHNFGRKHVACSGEESNIDGNYPYSGGLIGQFGLDVSLGTMYQPDEFADFMSYCDQTWTSDYTYWNIYQARQTTMSSSSLASETVEALYVSGVISPEGEVTLQPVYSQRTQIPVLPAGSHRLEVLNSERQTINSYAFTPYEIADSGGYRGFGFFVPAEDDLGGLRVLRGEQIVAEKYAGAKSKSLEVVATPPSVDRSGAQTRLRLPDGKERELAYRIRTSQDGGQTWKVLALDWAAATFPLPPEFDGGLLEFQSSDGLNTRTTVVDLGSSDPGSETE